VTHNWRRIAFGLGLAIVFLAAAVLGLWQLSKSRTFQLFGRLVYHCDTTERMVALTFDDGPDPRYVEEVLGILRSHGAHATFFLQGSDLAANPDCGRRLVEAGHQIANHSWSHKQMVLTNLRTISLEIESTDREILAVGQAPPIYFRPPYSKRLILLPYYLMKHNRTTVLWDVEPDSLPSQAKDPDLIYTDAVSKMKPGSILLMHVLTEARNASRVALSHILDYTDKEGFQVVTVGHLFGEK